MVVQLTIIFVLFLVIYGSAQQSTEENKPTAKQSFFFLSHSVFLDNNKVQIDGTNGSIIATGDLSYPRSGIQDIVDVNGTKAVIFSYGMSGYAGKTEVKTDVLKTTTEKVGQNGIIGNENLTYIGTAKGNLGTYHLYKVGNRTISVDSPTLLQIGNSCYMLSMKQNTLQIQQVKSANSSITQGLMLEGILLIIAIGVIIWIRKSKHGLLSS